MMMMMIYFVGINKIILNESCINDTLRSFDGCSRIPPTCWASSDSTPLRTRHNKNKHEKQNIKKSSSSTKTTTFFPPPRLKPPPIFPIPYFAIAQWRLPCFEAKYYDTASVISNSRLAKWCHSRPFVRPVKRARDPFHRFKCAAKILCTYGE